MASNRNVASSTCLSDGHFPGACEHFEKAASYWTEEDMGSILMAAVNFLVFPMKQCCSPPKVQDDELE